VYFQADLELEKRATEDQGRSMNYRPTERFEAHPTEPGVRCRVWEWTGQPRQ
jgi:hypothetical protein